MSRKRQSVHVCPKLPSPVTALAYDLGHGHAIPEHLHPEDQLVYACRGVMTVRTNAGTWVVPAQRAVWIPARTPHSILMSGAVSMRTIYLRARLVRRLPRTCCVVNVSPLLQQLIVHLCTVGKLKRKSKTHTHLIDVLIDQLETVQAVPLQLPSPSDPRAARAAAALQRNPRQRPFFGVGMQTSRGEQENRRKAVPTGNADVAGKMATAVAVVALVTAFGSWRENQPYRSGSGL